MHTDTRPTLRHRVAVLAVILGVFAATLQGRLTSTSLADVQGAFGVGPDEAAWLNTAFVVAEVSVVAPFVWLSEVLAIRRVFVPAALVFVIACAAMLRVGSFHELLALRVVQGISGGALIPMAAPTFRRKLPSTERLHAFALYGIAGSVPIALAPLCEAWFVEAGSFRFVFLPPAACALAGAVCGAWAFPRYPIVWTKLLHPDLVGLVLPSIGLVLVVLGVEHANRLDWSGSRWVRGMLVAGTLVLVAAVRHELTHPTPAFRLDILGNRNFTIGLVTYGVFRISLLAVVWAVPDFLARIQGLRPLDYASVFVAMALPQLVVPFVLLRWIHHVDLRRFVALALAFQCAACLRALGLDAGWSLPELLPVLVLHGIGQGLFFLPLLTLVALNIDVPHRSSAVALVSLVRVTGGSVGVATAATMLVRAEHHHQNVLNEHLVAGAGPVVDRLDAMARRLGARTADPGAMALQIVRGIARREAFVLGYADVFLAIGLLLLATIFLVLLLRPVSLDELGPVRSRRPAPSPPALPARPGA